jgi:hypothetical protein
VPEKSSITLKIEGKSFRTVKAVLFTWKGKKEMGVKIIAKEGGNRSPLSSWRREDWNWWPFWKR